jgi:hypothetical protein
MYNLIPNLTVRENIEVKNGKSMLMDDYQAIVGLGCPGYEPFKDSMEVTMKIKNFQCDYMSTVFTDGVFKDLDLSELTKTTNQLNHHHRNL